jgi:hypothetical protein
MIIIFKTLHHLVEAFLEIIILFFCGFVENIGRKLVFMTEICSDDMRAIEIANSNN